ncbi:MAG TPA: UDP-3-O-acyl-N-acetylglucosamine deacetylase [Candidatus Baltobacteraceae bacterium]|jgi:UDP-3-O-[3-hydroxymyristoyl] N-acetylglucosamine deacetylase|nr:UDP-3-O-acyl-N-acetylglucosamine deacetylase [Candidatus Baltobacteraceae bacterium]
MNEQKTLRKAVHLEGVGLHTGSHAIVDVLPAQPNTGIAFSLVSGEKTTTVPATAENVVDTSRATVIGRDGASVSTTEHLLSALFASGVSNAEIRVEGKEIPIGDGSSRGFYDAIESAGVVSQRAPRPVFAPSEPFVVQSGERMVAVLPAPAFRVRFVADFPAPIGTQYFYGEIEPTLYRDEIAAARTFGYLHEVEALRARGLALGGSLDNALVFAPDGPMQPLRWPNEVVRHKVLDLIGDFALLGAWPQCEIVAIKSGHELHALVARKLRARVMEVPIGG